jgi:crossover junction endodeoxyribonuclease RuvC
VGLASIAHKVRDRTATERPKEIVVEDGYVGFGENRNPPAQLALAEARGVIIVAASESGRTVSVYSPAEVKKAATGKGNAKKDVVAKFVAQI